MIKNIRTHAFIFLIAASTIALADHGQGDNISSIDGDGNGIFNGTLVHAAGSGADHPWYTFCAISGNTVLLELETPSFTSVMHVFDVFDNNAQVGDANSVDYDNLVQSADGNDISLNFVAPSSGQFIIQVDSWLGGDGDYTLTISGASASPCATNSLDAKSIPTLGNWSIIAMLALILAFGAVTLRRQN